MSLRFDRQKQTRLRTKGNGGGWHEKDFRSGVVSQVRVLVPVPATRVTARPGAV